MPFLKQGSPSSGKSKAELTIIQSIDTGGRRITRANNYFSCRTSRISLDYFGVVEGSVRVGILDSAFGDLDHAVVVFYLTTGEEYVSISESRKGKRKMTCAVERATRLRRTRELRVERAMIIVDERKTGWKMVRPAS